MKKIEDNELNKIAGGNISETSKDADLLHKKGLLDHEIFFCYFVHYWKQTNKEVTDAWKRTGVDVILSNDWALPNRYFVGGKEITRAEALKRL